jgi:hypothetical protein
MKNIAEDTKDLASMGYEKTKKFGSKVVKNTKKFGKIIKKEAVKTGQGFTYMKNDFVDLFAKKKKKEKKEKNEIEQPNLDDDFDEFTL